MKFNILSRVPGLPEYRLHEEKTDPNAGVLSAVRVFIHSTLDIGIYLPTYAHIHAHMRVHTCTHRITGQITAGTWF